jgi:coatomer subunit beta'
MSSSILTAHPIPAHCSSQIYWSPTGALVAIASGESFYILRFNRDAYIAKVDAGADLGDEGVEEAFEIVTEVSEK